MSKPRNPQQQHRHEQRRADAVTLLLRPEGVTLAAMAKHLGVSIKTARRMLYLAAADGYNVTRSLRKLDAEHGREGRYFAV